jgi:hypothetical protein
MLPESAQRRRVVGWTPSIELAAVRESQSLRSNDIAVTFLLYGEIELCQS